MKKDEYERKLKEIEDIAEEGKLNIGREYALSNNPFKVGDIVEDHCGRVIVEKIKIYRTNPPTCVYWGTEYTKNGLPRKDGRKRGAYQLNLI